MASISRWVSESPLPRAPGEPGRTIEATSRWVRASLMPRTALDHELRQVDLELRVVVVVAEHGADDALKLDAQAVARALRGQPLQPLLREQRDDLVAQLDLVLAQVVERLRVVRLDRDRAHQEP